MKLEVLRYSDTLDFHECKSPSGETHRVDLLIDGGLTLPKKDISCEELLEFKKSLVGKTVEVAYLSTFMEIAHQVRIVGEPQPGVCNKCGCFEERACRGGCSWANEEKTICSNCVPNGGEEA